MSTVETIRIEHDGVGLHVEVEGPADAVPVAFLHGMTSCGKTWEWLPDELTAGRRIIRIDLRGHGRSDHATRTYNVERYGSDVAAVLRQVAERPAVLVGHSLGGVVAWWVAQQHPELVAAAFLEDPPLYAGEPSSPEAERYRIIFTAMRDNATAWQQEGLSQDEWAERMGALQFGPPGSPTLRDIAMDDAVAAMGFAHSVMDPSLLDGAIDGSTLAAVDTASPVTPPVVVLAADVNLGAVFSEVDAERMAETHPDVDVVRVAGSGHGIHDERRHRDVFSEHLARFLAVHAPPT